MGQLALSVGGAVAGAAIGTVIPGVGWAIGARVGFILGSVAGSLLFPQKGPKPQQGDTKVQIGSYGAPIALMYGTDRTAGALIWVKGNAIEAHSKTESGKGMGGAGATTITYTASFAVLIGEGPIDGVRRIWIDGKLVFDISGSRLADEIAAAGPINATTAAHGANIRVYVGSETQLPDSLIEADLGDGNAPAYRGSAYLVFDDLPLGDFANHIGNVTAEYVKNGTLTYLNKELTAPDTTGASIGQHGFDEYGPFFWNAHSGGNVTKWNLTTAALELQADVSLQVDGNGNPITIENEAPVTDEFGNVYVTAAIANTHASVYKFDAATLTYLGHVEDFSGGVAVQWNYRSFHAGAERWLFGISLSGNLVVIDALNFRRAAANLSVSTGTSSALQVDMTPDREFFIAYKDTSPAESRVKRVSMSPDPAGVFPYLLTLSASTDVTATLGTGLDHIHYYADEEVVLLGSGNGTIAKFDQNSSAIVASVAGAMGVINCHYEWRKGPVNGKLWNYVSGDAKETDIATMTVTRTIAVSSWASSGGGKDAVGYDKWTDALVAIHSGNQGRRMLFLPRLDPLAVDRADVILDLSERAGLVSTDLDLALVVDTIRGYTVRRETNARGAVEPILQSGFIDAVEVDRKVRFIPRGQSPLLAVAADDQGAAVEGEQTDRLTEVLADEIELPERIAINYVDPDAQYDQVTQTWQRASEATRSREKTTFQTAEVMTADAAKRLAAKLGTAAWVESTALRFGLSRRHAKLAPADVVDFTRGNVAYELRLTRIDEGGGVVLCEGVPQEAAAYVSDAEGAGASIPTPILQLLSPTQLMLVDSNLARDEDDNGGFYIALARSVAGGLWPGAQIHKSEDGVAFAAWNSFAVEAEWGIATKRLFDAPATVTDRYHTLTVQMVRGELASVAELDMLNGANAFLLQSGDDWEIIQAADVTDLGSGAYRLETFLRGRRGTEAATAGHAAGDRFIVLSASLLARLESAAEIGLQRYYKATTFGAIFDPTGAIAFTNRARGLMPYAPVHIAGTRDGSNNLTGTFVRRSRLGGEYDWSDGIADVQLGEASEAYQVDILDGATVVRTISVASESFSYSAANQTTDGFTPGDPISGNVYQISATIGRGRAGSFTI